MPALYTYELKWPISLFKKAAALDNEGSRKALCLLFSAYSIDPWSSWLPKINFSICLPLQCYQNPPKSQEKWEFLTPHIHSLQHKNSTMAGKILYSFKALGTKRNAMKIPGNCKNKYTWFSCCFGSVKPSKHLYIFPVIVLLKLLICLCFSSEVLNLGYNWSAGYSSLRNIRKPVSIPEAIWEARLKTAFYNQPRELGWLAGHQF